ncbi:hypothetical protein ACFWG0_37635 [Streptomyces yangpuensis]|uniref:hypothetical protein n=1 Tax=Streptomyces yangpuensis TaxID=1648182 RepID=UPI003659744D
MPHVLLRARAAQRFDGDVQEQDQASERHPAGVAGRAGQVRVPGGDQVGAGVLVASPEPKRYSRNSTVSDPPRSFLRHHDRGRLSRITPTVAASTRATASRARATTSAAAAGPTAAGGPVAARPYTGLGFYDADAEALTW